MPTATGVRPPSRGFHFSLVAWAFPRPENSEARKHSAGKRCQPQIGRRRFHEESVSEWRRVRRADGNYCRGWDCL